MRKTTLLNSLIGYEISKIGHTQSICIADCGLPIPQDVKRIDVAISAGIPSFMDTLKAVTAEMQVEKAVFALEFKDSPLSKKSVEHLRSLFPKIIIEYIPHTEFKIATTSSVAVIRTGEQTPYANVLLYSGVVF